jgi:hypothetical protein
MNIEIGDYRLSRADELNLVLEQRREVQKPHNPNLVQKNTHKYYFIGFVCTLEQGLNKIVNHATSNTEANSIKECLAEIHEIKSMIKIALNQLSAHDSTTAGSIAQSYASHTG